MILASGNEVIMRFWENAYDGRIFNLDYDRLTADQDAQTRSLIRHTGLEWEDACLFPEKNQRVVRTASNEQVRQPVYKGSSANWKKFDPFIDGSFDHL